MSAAPHPAAAPDYALQRFLQAPEAAGLPAWLDDQGRVVSDRARAVEARLIKYVAVGGQPGRQVLTIRLPIAEAMDLGLIRGAA